MPYGAAGLFQTKCRELRDRLAKETEAALERQRDELETAANR